MSEDAVAKILDAEEMERRCVARMLHDVIGQSMSRVLLDLEMLDGVDAERAGEMLGRIQGQIGAVVEDMGSLARNMAGASGCASTSTEMFSRYARDFERVYGLAVSVLSWGGLESGPLPDGMLAAVLRCVRAMLVQLAIPEGARGATIEVEALGVPELRLSLTFEPPGQATPDSERISLVERVVAVHGGSLTCLQQAGVVTVQLRLPWIAG